MKIPIKILRQFEKFATQKFLPFLILTLSFTFFLSLQITLEKLSAKGTTTPVVDSADSNFNHLHYEKLFNSAKFSVVSGKEIKLSLLEEKIVVMNFWASWCLPCLKEIPSLVEFSKKFKGKVFVLGINSDSAQDLRKVKKILKENNVEYENFLDQKEEITDKFMLQSLPFTVIFKKGKVFRLITKEFNFMKEDFLAEISKELSS